jgi:hypothetical protein
MYEGVLLMNIPIFGKTERTPEQKAVIFTDMYLQKQCMDNESIVVTDDEINNIYVDYKAVRNKKAISTAFKLPLWLMTILTEKTMASILDDCLVVARRKAE